MHMQTITVMRSVWKKDPPTITLALVLLSAVAMIAGYIPAARAARVNPVLALRHE